MFYRVWLIFATEFMGSEPAGAMFSGRVIFEIGSKPWYSDLENGDFTACSSHELRYALKSGTGTFDDVINAVLRIPTAFVAACVHFRMIFQAAARARIPARVCAI